MKLCIGISSFHNKFDVPVKFSDVISALQEANNEEVTFYRNPVSFPFSMAMGEMKGW